MQEGTVMNAVMISPEETFVDSKEKVYSAMLEILECIIHYVKFPQTRDDEEVAGMFKQAEWVIERAHLLQKDDEAQA